MNEPQIFQHTCSPQKNHQISVRTIKELLHHVPQQLSQPHRINFYAIHLYTEGSGTHQVDFKNITVKPGRMVFISNGQVHRFDPQADYDGFALMFTEDFFGCTDFYRQFLHKSAVYHDPLQPSYFDTGDRFEELSSLLGYMMKEQKRRIHDLQELTLHNYLVNILFVAERQYGARYNTPTSASHNQIISKFKALATARLMDHLPVKYYARELNITQRTLENAFSKTEHTSPKKWLTERMILEVKRYLCYEGELPIKAISDRIGFKEVSNFIKFFKTETGLTPAAFRRSLKKLSS